MPCSMLCFVASTIHRGINKTVSILIKMDGDKFLSSSNLLHIHTNYTCIGIIIIKGILFVNLRVVKLGWNKA